MHLCTHYQAEMQECKFSYLHVTEYVTLTYIIQTDFRLRYCFFT